VDELEEKVISNKAPNITRLNNRFVRVQSKAKCQWWWGWLSETVSLFQRQR